MKFVVAALLVVVALGTSGCGVCAIYCPKLQRIVFEDSSGNPLTPLAVTDGETQRCEADGGVSGTSVTCAGNSLTYDLRSTAPRTIRAEALTGEVFSGEIVPMTVPGTPRPLNGCGCGGDTLRPITVKLTAP